MVDSHYKIRKRVKDAGKELEVKELARRLQNQFSEPGTKVQYRDAYEMAYYDVIVERAS